MNRWFSILAIELQTRIVQNFEEFNTWPRSISASIHVTQRLLSFC